MITNNDNLKAGFKTYLETEWNHLQNKQTIVSDAFYLLRHDVGITFQAVVQNEVTMEVCQVKLEAYLKNSKKQKFPRENARSYVYAMKMLKQYLKEANGVPRPSKVEMEKYLRKWDETENYVFPDQALEKLFTKTYPKNTELENVLIKVSSLNDFYSTNIYKPLRVAKHIIALNIDERLHQKDATLVHDIAKIEMDNGKTYEFYSFATKYCSHHHPEEYPIYDSYVEKILKYFRDEDHFADFKVAELKTFSTFKAVLLAFRSFYGLEEYSLKDIDRYLWQLGKEKFPKTY